MATQQGSASWLGRRRLVQAAAVAVLARAAGALALDVVPAYEQRRASADGTGKVFLGREIAGVMGWQGAAWLEREEREREERTDLLLGELGLRPGMQVADVGAGTGYMARRMAPLVLPGSVFAVDVQPQMVAMLREMVARTGLSNVRPVLGTERATGLEPASIDLALLVDVYHELAYPYEVMASIVQALRPGGRVVLVEYRAEDPRVPIKPAHKMSEAQARREMALHPLVHERTGTTLPWQHVLVFRKR
jgi:SAM-dependent methyltransferase